MLNLEAIRASRHLVAKDLSDFSDIARNNPYFDRRHRQTALSATRKGYRNPDEEGLYRTERDAKVAFAKAIDEEYEAKGRPQSLEEPVLAAYAAIPQKRMWIAPHLRPDDPSLASAFEPVSNGVEPTTHLTYGDNLYTSLSCMGKPTKALIDTGSAYTIIDQGLLSAEDLSMLTPGNSAVPRVLSATGQALSFTGTAKAVIQIGSRRADLCVLLAHGLPCGGIVGLDAFLALGLTVSVTTGGRTMTAVNNGNELISFRQIGLTPNIPVCAPVVCPAGNNLSSILALSETAPCTPRDLPNNVAGYCDILYEQLAREGCAQMLGLLTAGGAFLQPFKAPYRITPPVQASFANNMQSNFSTSICAATELVPTARFITIEAMCAKAQNLTDEQRQRLHNLCNKYSDIWNAGDKPLALTNLTKFKVEVPADATPIGCRPRHVGPDKRRRIAEQVKLCLDKGLITPSESEWASAVVLQPKPDGTDRLCIDYRRLNSITRVPAYPMPRVQQAIDSLQGKRYFSIFDFPSAYWQVEVDADSRKYLAFITPDGLYEWKRMPFGAAGAPATQQRMIDKLLAGMKWISALAYLDDVVIYSDTFEQHLLHLEMFFARVAKANLQLHPGKSKPCQSETRYLGFLVSASGLRPDPAKTAPIRDFVTPTDVRSVRSFLGMCSYYRRFIPNFARVAEPL